MSKILSVFMVIMASAIQIADFKHQHLAADTASIYLMTLAIWFKLDCLGVKK